MTYRITRSTILGGDEVIEVEDWIDAERLYAELNASKAQFDKVELRGVHPSHRLAPYLLACQVCGFGRGRSGATSQEIIVLRAPCGFSFAGRTLQDLTSDLGHSRYSMPERHIGKVSGPAYSTTLQGVIDRYEKARMLQVMTSGPRFGP